MGNARLPLAGSAAKTSEALHAASTPAMRQGASGGFLGPSHCALALPFCPLSMLTPSSPRRTVVRFNERFEVHASLYKVRRQISNRLSAEQRLSVHGACGWAPSPGNC